MDEDKLIKDLKLQTAVLDKVAELLEEVVRELDNLVKMQKENLNG